MFAGVLLLNVGRGDRRWFRWVGLAAVGAGVVLGLTEAVRDPNPSAWMKVAYRLSTELAGTLAAVNVLMMSRHGGLARVLRRAAVGLALALGGVLMLMTVAAYAEPLFGVVAPTMAMVWAGRVLATMIVLFPGAVFAVVLARSQARALARVAPTGVRHVMLECPTCRAVGPVSVRYGGACPQCLTRFCVTVIEPRCSECDYLLVGTAGNRCPECGTPFDRPPALAADIVKPGAAGAPAPVVAMPPTASMA
jgi:hypothetical protein